MEKKSEINLYEVKKAWEISGVISHLIAAQEKEIPKTIFIDIGIKPIWNEDGVLVGYQISTISKALNDI